MGWNPIRGEREELEEKETRPQGGGVQGGTGEKKRVGEWGKKGSVRRGLNGGEK